MHALQRSSGPSSGNARTNESDAYLVALAKQDVRSFAPLYERYRDDVLRYCVRSLGDREDAADATQQTFTNALAALDRFQDADDSFRGWLFRIAHNEVIDRHRQRRRRSEHPLADVSWVVDTGRTPEELSILADDRNQVSVLLLSLTPDQRRCCQLRFAGLTYGETAAILGKSEVAVRASFCRGLASLRTRMGDVESL